MRHRTRRRLIIAVLFASTIALSLGSSEFAARLWLAQRTAAAIMPDGRAWAYQDAPYWGDAFQADRVAMARSIYYVGDVRHGDYSGKYMSMHDGWRGTSDQPVTWQHTVWLVGPSTVYDEEVPDYYTKASYLQRLLKPYNLRVMNISESGANLITMTTWLARLDIRPGDTVIFFAASVSGGTSLTDLRNASLPGKLCQTLKDGYSQMALSTAYCTVSDKLLAPSKISNAELARMLSAYRKYMLSARQYITERGARLVNILQPAIYSMPLSSLERTIVSSYPDLAPDFEQMWNAFYPQWQAESERLAQDGIETHDLLHVLDPLRRRGEIVYIDHVHTTDRGNAVIARAIYDAVWQTF